MKLRLVRSGGEAPAPEPAGKNAPVSSVINDLPAVRSINTPEKIPDPPSAGASLERATAAQRERAAGRLAAVDRSDELHAGGVARTTADAMAAAEHGVSRAAVGRWRRRCKGLGPGARLAALLEWPRAGRPPAGWDGPGTAALWSHWLTDRLREGPDGDGADGPAVHRRLGDIAASRGWDLPPLDAFLRRERREVPRREKVRARRGAMAFLETQPKQRRSVAGLDLLEIVNGDGRRQDVWAELPSGRVGRPVVWVWQDVRSRRLLAWEAGETESVDIVRTSLHRVIVEYGVPGGVLVDNTLAASAKWLTGGMPHRKRWRSSAEELPGLLASLDIRYAATGVERDAGGRGQGRGWAKPVERAFADLKGQIEGHPRLAGALTGRSTEARPENHRSRAVPWEIFLDVAARAVAEYNARPGRRMEIAAGRSIDDVWREEYPRLVVRRLSPRQAGLLLLSAEDPAVRGDGTFALKAGRASGLPANRYRATELVEWAGRRVAARFDPLALHGACQVYDLDGRWICEAPCWI